MQCHLIVCMVSCSVMSNSIGLGFPDGASGKEPTCQYRRLKRCGFNLAGYIQSIALQSDMTEVTQQAHVHRLQPTRLLCPWDFPGQNTAVGCHFPLRGIFPIQESNPRFLYLLRWQADCLPLSHLGSPQHHLVQAVLFNHYLYLCEYIFITPKENSIPVKQSLTFLPLPQPLATISQLYVSMD